MMSKGTPLEGDHSAFNDVDHPDVNSQEVRDGTPRLHNPWPASAGQAPVSNGTEYVATDIVTQAEHDAHTHTFVALTDTPGSYTGQAGKVPAVNVGEDALEFVDFPTHTFVALTDTPGSYTGQAGKVPAVNVGEDALEFVDFPSDTLSNTNRIWLRDKNGLITEYAADNTGIAAALAASGSGDVVKVVNGDYTADLTIPAGASVECDGFAAFTGEITGADGAFLTNAYIVRTANDANPLVGIDGPASGVFTVINCVVQLTQSGSGDALAVRSNGGNVKVTRGEFDAQSTGGAGYALYRGTGGRIDAYHARLDGSTAVGNDAANIGVYSIQSGSTVSGVSYLSGDRADVGHTHTPGFQTLTDAASIAWDLADGSAQVTLGDNRTLANPTNLSAGATYFLKVVQDGAGGRTLAFDTAYKWAGGTAPTLSTGIGAVDLFVFYCDGVSMYGSVAGLNYS
jgi:hypothetical protein